MSKVLLWFQAVLQAGERKAEECHYTQAGQAMQLPWNLRVSFWYDVSRLSSIYRELPGCPHPTASLSSRRLKLPVELSAHPIRMNAHPMQKTCCLRKKHVKLSFFTKYHKYLYSKQLPPMNSLSIEIFGTSSDGMTGTKLNIERSLCASP
ncbi:hypothetical protein SDC9_128596 [bioreactor metagenome]|uniref:Uncharacterized protein n=1 Tax=bioreactor metagenome TaxID=1076179 RepID=A0A645CXX0_9ZZZZ